MCWVGDKIMDVSRTDVERQKEQETLQGCTGVTGELG